MLHALAKDAEGSGRVFDSAAGYGGGGSESYAGQWAEEDGFGENIFWATKVNVAARGGGSADPAAVRAQIERSFERMRLDVIDLDQVHNMGDPPTQIGILEEYKQEGRIRYIGMTTTSSRQYDGLEQVMRDYPIDFIGIDYAIDNRVAAESEIWMSATMASSRCSETTASIPSSRAWRCTVRTASRYGGSSSGPAASEANRRSCPKYGISSSRCASLNAMSSARLFTGAPGPRLSKYALIPALNS